MDLPVYNTITVIIPAFNEESSIGPVIQKLTGTAVFAEIIVVDDGSTDHTAEIAAQFSVRIIRHETNKGYGAALKTGIRKARGEKIILIDSDGQHDPGYIPQLCGMLNDFDMVIGERGKDSPQQAANKFGKKIIRIIGEYLVEQPLPDFNSGLRGMDRALITRMLHIMPNGFSFSTTSTLAFLKEGYSIGTIPIRTSDREGRKSTVKFFRDGFRTIMLILRIIMLFNPLKIFIPASLLLFIGGMGFGIYGYIAFARFSNAAVLITLMGVIMFFIGLLAEQIAILNRK